MRNYFIKSLKRIPFVKKKIKSLKGLNINDMIIDYIDSKNPIIIDVGANNGSTIKNYLTLFKNPQIHSFEPTPHLFSKLENKYNSNPKVNLSNFALSNNNGETQLFESDYSPTNSILKPNIDLYTKLGTKMSKFSNLSETFKKSLKPVTINTIRFDDWYKKNLRDLKIDIFKTDTQGFDFEVLNGAQNTLSKIKFIIVECQFQEFYMESKPFYKMFEFLYNNGFYIHNIHKKNNLSQIYECDAIFINATSQDKD